MTRFVIDYVIGTGSQQFPAITIRGEIRAPDREAAIIALVLACPMIQYIKDIDEVTEVPV